MQRPKMLWADIGMVIAVGVFIAVVMLFHGEDVFITAMAVYFIALLVWTFFCEWAASRVDATTAVSIKHRSSSAHSSPIPH